MRFTKRSAVISITATVIAILVASACSDEAAPPEDNNTTSGPELCQLMASQLQKCGATTPCDDAIVQDCASLVGILSDAMLANATTCLKNGGTALSCVIGAVQGLTPTETHTAFGDNFCEVCTGGFGVDTCKSTLFSSESTFQVGAILLPFGDGIVQKISDSCVTDIAGCATIVGCVQTTLLEEAIPQATIECVVNSLADPSTVPAPSNCGDGGAPAGGNGQGGHGQGGDGQGGAHQGGNGQGGTENCVDQCVATYPGGLTDLQAVYDCLFCGACFDVCANQVPCSGGMEMGCSSQSMDCDACLDGDCSLNVCILEILDCDDNPECWPLDDCVQSCP